MPGRFRMIAGVLASLAELELELGRERRAAAREARRARGSPLDDPKCLTRRKPVWRSGCTQLLPLPSARSLGITRHGQRGSKDPGEKQDRDSPEDQETFEQQRAIVCDECGQEKQVCGGGDDSNVSG